MLKEVKNYIQEDHSFNQKTMIAILGLLIVISGFIGFVYEYIFYYFDGGMKNWYWQGGNFLPWINIYAIGALFVYFLTYKKRKSVWKVFWISLITCGVLEYISGLGIYVLFDGARYWDYNTEILNFGNIGGFVCLRSVLVFGFSSLLLMYGLVPFLFYLAKKMNIKTLLTISILLFSIVMMDEFYNLIVARAFHLPRSTDVYIQIGWKEKKVS